ncbi:MAG: SusE domain-containing protein [Bacteroidetes bacterium]|nr:SusE domain-containing protein [Bacteroidota bacterium]
MKKIAFIVTVFIGLGLLFSCEKELRDPKLDPSQAVKPEISSPTSGSSFVLLKDQADSVLTTFIWSETHYNLTDLETTKYILEMDLEQNNFSSPYTLTSTTSTAYEMTVTQMNKILLVLELDPDVAYDLAFRVRSFVNSITTYSNVISAVITLTITPYSDEIFIKPIYLLGSGTTIGWSNILALPMEHIGQGQFARVETLTPGSAQYIKFISVLGQWAPQWGTDATGTAEGGILVYRPTESVPDPPAIPVGVDAGPYYIMADTLQLAYETFLTSGELYLLGDATLAGWDNTAGLKLTEDQPHVFSIITTLNATGTMKFLEVSGQWAPQWGTNGDGSNKKGFLIYRPTEGVPDPPGIPAPSVAGQYKITVDLTTMQYTVEQQ